MAKYQVLAARKGEVWTAVGNPIRTDGLDEFGVVDRLMEARLRQVRNNREVRELRTINGDSREAVLAEIAEWNKEIAQRKMRMEFILNYNLRRNPPVLALPIRSRCQCGQYVSATPGLDRRVVCVCGRWYRVVPGKGGEYGTWDLILHNDRRAKKALKGA